MEITPRKIAFSLAVAVVAAIYFRSRTRTDEFFPNIGLRVPQNAISSHHTRESLTSESHEITFNLSGVMWKPIAKNMATREGWSNFQNTLIPRYKEFRSGHEAFFPARPTRASAGEFLVHGADGYPYYCRFVRDDTTGNVWFYSVSFDN